MTDLEAVAKLLATIEYALDRTIGTLLKAVESGGVWGGAMISWLYGLIEDACVRIFGERITYPHGTFVGWKWRGMVVSVQPDKIDWKHGDYYASVSVDQTQISGPVPDQSQLHGPPPPIDQLTNINDARAAGESIIARMRELLHPVWQCPACGRTESPTIPRISSYSYSRPICKCGYDGVRSVYYQMRPLNDDAKRLDGVAESAEGGAP